MDLGQGREPLRRSSLVAEVVTLLRDVIETKGLAPGDRLPTEAELVESLEVSRPVLREAVSQLETLGLAERPSTRLLVNAARLLEAGTPPRAACDHAIVEALTDDLEVAAGLRDLIALVF